MQCMLLYDNDHSSRLCWGLTTCQPLWVILCHLPEKVIEEIVEEMKERVRKKEEQE